MDEWTEWLWDGWINRLSGVGELINGLVEG